MPVKIRLARHGKKDAPFYHVVVADSRAPRDGKFIEKIGSYNPNTNPATITLEFNRALHWLLQGAQPTDTARAILSYQGVMYKKHLLGGVAKNAFTAEQAEQKFEAWMADKASRINAKTVAIKDASRADAKKRLEEETKANEARIKAIEAKKAAAEAAPAEEEADAEQAAEESADVAQEAAPEAQETTAPEAEAPAAEEQAAPAEAAAAEEAPAEEVAATQAAEESAETAEEAAPAE